MREEVYVIMSDNKYLYLGEETNGKVSIKWSGDPLEGFLFESMKEVKDFIESSHLLSPNFIVNDNRKIITFPKIKTIVVQKIKLTLFNVKDVFIDDLNEKNKIASDEYNKTVERLLNLSDEIISDDEEDTK